MARFKIAKDGHPYLTHGYKVLDKYGEDVRYSTYQFHPRAEMVLNEAGFPEGESLPREVFYALLVDGDLYNDVRPDGIPITAVPYDVRDVAKSLVKSDVFALIEQKFPSQRFVIDFYRFLMNAKLEAGVEISSETRIETLTTASYLSLAFHIRNQL